MKRITLVLLLALLAGIFVVSSCKKQVHANEEVSTNTATEALISPTTTTTITRDPICSTCSKTFNLVQKQQTLTYREGLNTISALDNGITAVVKTQKGQVSQYLLQDRSGKQYLPQSMKRTSQTALRPGGGYADIYVICYYTPYGWYCIWVIYY